MFAILVSSPASLSKVKYPFSFRLPLPFFKLGQFEKWFLVIVIYISFKERRTRDSEYADKLGAYLVIAICLITVYLEIVKR